MYFSRPYSDSPVLFKAYFIFKDFKKALHIQVLSGLFEPCYIRIFLLNLFPPVLSVDNLCIQIGPRSSQKKNGGPDMNPNCFEKNLTDDKINAK